MFITGTNDNVAFPNLVHAMYQALDSELERSFINLMGLFHSDILEGPYKAKLSQFMVSWLNMHLNDDRRYQKYFDQATVDEPELFEDPKTDFSYQKSH